MTTCIVENVAMTATPLTHEYAFCDICDVYTPLVFCDIAEEEVCGLCHFAYVEDYHE